MASPVPHLLIILTVTVMQGLYFGQEIAATAFEDVDFSQPEGVLEILQEIIQAVWATIQFFFGLLVSLGALIASMPWFLAVPVGFYFAGTLLWSVAGIIRGGGD